jgi:hypothetical protein
LASLRERRSLCDPDPSPSAQDDNHHLKCDRAMVFICKPPLVAAAATGYSK